MSTKVITRSEPADYLQSSINALYDVGQSFYRVTRTFLDDVKCVMKSSDGADTLLRYINESIVLNDLMQRSEKVARPVLNSISKTRTIFAVSRIIQSVQYITSGDALADWNENKIAPFIASLAAFMSRSWIAIDWLVQHNLVGVDRLASIAAKIGSVPVLGRSVTFIRGPFLSLAYLVESLAYVKTNIVDLKEEKNVARSRIELVSACAEAALSVVTLIGVVNPIPATVLGLIASGTGLAAFFLDPANTIVSKP